MKKLILTLCLSSSLLACSTSQDQEAKITPLLNQSVADGCGCYLKSKKENKYYYWNDFGFVHYFGINGTEKIFRNCDKAGKSEKIGDQHTLICIKQYVTAEISFTVTSKCRPSDEACEFTNRSGTLTVKSNGKTNSINLIGGCGC